MAQPVNKFFDLLLISDLHLGSHLKPRLRGESVHLAARVDEQLPRFLDHYLAEGGRWQLVINGDFIDFWNIVLAGEQQLTGQALALSRLHTALDAYPGIEDALIRFLRAGNGIVFVTGNHDAELLYPAVRRALVERLEGEPAEASDIQITGATHVAQLCGGRVRFVAWFLREDGGVWIEHGHNFDPPCATTDVLSPTRGDRLVMSLAEVATRSFTNLMPEIDYDAPNKYTTVDYLRWAGARGLRFVLLVVTLYLRMIGRMLKLWARTGRVDRDGRARHGERLARVAQNSGLQMNTLTAIAGMAPPPSSATVGGVLSVTALDGILSFIAAAVCSGLVVGWLTSFWWVGFVAGVGGGLIAARGVLHRRRKRAIHEDMAEVAASVGKVAGTPVVLMGHSHHGDLCVNDGVIYGNSGCWLDGSHLVVRREPSTRRLAEVELRNWRNNGVVVRKTLRVPRM
ncbi:MAG: hypothetical protein ACPG77_03170 [Nannocystaceae bacterium]